MSLYQQLSPTCFWLNNLFCIEILPENMRTLRPIQIYNLTRLCFAQADGYQVYDCMRTRKSQGLQNSWTAQYHRYAL